MVDVYLSSVGRAANLILNIAPDGTGAVPSADITRYAEFGAAIKCLFSDRVGSGGARVITEAAPAVWEFGVGGIRSNNLSVAVLEDQTDGQMIGRWSLDCRRGADHWSLCHTDEGSVFIRCISRPAPGLASPLFDLS